MIQIVLFGKSYRELSVLLLLSRHQKSKLLKKPISAPDRWSWCLIPKVTQPQAPLKTSAKKEGQSHSNVHKHSPFFLFALILNRPQYRMNVCRKLERHSEQISRTSGGRPRIETRSNKQSRDSSKKRAALAGKWAPAYRPSAVAVTVTFTLSRSTAFIIVP